MQRQRTIEQRSGLLATDTKRTRLHSAIQENEQASQPSVPSPLRARCRYYHREALRLRLSSLADRHQRMLRFRGTAQVLERVHSFDLVTLRRSRSASPGIGLEVITGPAPSG